MTFSDSISEHKIALSPYEINLLIGAVASAVGQRAVKTAQTIESSIADAQQENLLIAKNGEF